MQSTGGQKGLGGETSPRGGACRGAVPPAVIHVTATLTEIVLVCFFFPPPHLFFWSKICSAQFERPAPRALLQRRAEGGAGGSLPWQRGGARRGEGKGLTPVPRGRWGAIDPPCRCRVSLALALALWLYPSTWGPAASAMGGGHFPITPCPWHPSQSRTEAPRGKAAFRIKPERLSYTSVLK